MVTLMTFLPLAAALLIGARSGMPSGQARKIAAGALLASAGLGLWMGWRATGMEPAFGERAVWAPGLGLEYRTGIDSLSGGFVMLTAWLTAGVLLVPAPAGAGRGYWGLLCWQVAGLYGAFTAQNFLHWFLFWEMSLAPAFLLMFAHGGAEGRRAAAPFVLWTVAGSIPMLAGFLAVREHAGSFDFAVLGMLGAEGGVERALGPWAGLVFGMLLAAFAVKTPVWPLHAWLPGAYASAPLAGTMLMSGALSKLGIYGMARILIPLFPDQTAAWGGWLGLAGGVTIVAGGLAACAQRDARRMLAYASLSHTGFCVVGLFAVGSAWGWGTVSDRMAAAHGALAHAANHGLAAPLLFAVMGMAASRLGTWDVAKGGGLRARAPGLAAAAGLAVMAGVGLPGLSLFPSEWVLFRGVWPLQPWAAGLALAGVILGTWYLLTLYQRWFLGPGREGVKDLDAGERALACVLLAPVVAVGLWPALLFDRLAAAAGWLGRGGG